jgi:hypothetical protein
MEVGEQQDAGRYQGGCNFLCTTCPSYQDYLRAKEGMHLLIEAHIWQCLVQAVFNCNLWAETRDQKSLKSTDLSDNPFTKLKKALSMKCIVNSDIS